MPFLAPELLNLISDFVIADDDSITLRECSLAFPQITTRFQRALCLKKPAIFSFYPGTDRDPAQQGMFRTLFEILDANPGFGACLPEVRFQFQEKRFLSDPRVHHIARHCTQVVTLVIRFEEGVGWDEFSEANRLALENIIQSPILKTLKLLSVGAAWSTFLHPRPFLESLILEGDYYGTPSNPSSRNDDMPIPTTIENLTGSPKELRCLANALLDGTSRDSFAIDIGRLRTLSTHCRTREVADLRHFLLRADMLETLMLSATYFTTLVGLFQRPHPRYFSSLRHIILRSTTYLASATFSALAEELCSFPDNNVLTIIAVEVCVPGYSVGDSGLTTRTKEDILALLKPLGKSVFPCLQSVLVAVSVSLVSGRTISSQLKVQQLKVRKAELEGMEWDFKFIMDVKEHFACV